MVRIVNHCYSNLNYKNVVEEPLGDDITNEIVIGTSPVTLLSTVSLNRKIIKLYTVEGSSPSAIIWIRHGTNISVNNASFGLPMRRLYENTSQATRPFSVICSEGTALVKLTVVNKI
jgi:hypothetical protein